MVCVIISLIFFNLRVFAESANNQIPQVDIEYPTYGQEPLYFNFSGTAYDNKSIELVEVSIDSIQWFVANGTTRWYYNFSENNYTFDRSKGYNGYTFYARSFNGHNYSEIDSVKFPLGNVIPVCKTIYPSNNQTVSGLINIYGTAYDLNGNDTIQQVQVYINGKYYIADGTNNWSLNYDTTQLDDGWYCVIVYGIDEREPSDIGTFSGIFINNSMPEKETFGFEFIFLLYSFCILIIIKKAKMKS